MRKFIIIIIVAFLVFFLLKTNTKHKAEEQIPKITKNEIKESKLEKTHNQVKNTHPEADKDCDKKSHRKKIIPKTISRKKASEYGFNYNNIKKESKSRKNIDREIQKEIIKNITTRNYYEIENIIKENSINSNHRIGGESLISLLVINNPEIDSHIIENIISYGVTPKISDIINATYFNTKEETIEILANYYNGSLDESWYNNYQINNLATLSAENINPSLLFLFEKRGVSLSDGKNINIIDSIGFPKNKIQIENALSILRFSLGKGIEPSEDYSRVKIRSWLPEDKKNEFKEIIKVEKNNDYEDCIFTLFNDNIEEIKSEYQNKMISLFTFGNIEHKFSENEIKNAYDAFKEIENPSKNIKTHNENIFILELSLAFMITNNYKTEDIIKNTYPGMHISNNITHIILEKRKYDLIEKLLPYGLNLSNNNKNTRNEPPIIHALRTKAPDEIIAILDRNQ